MIVDECKIKQSNRDEQINMQLLSIDMLQIMFIFVTIARLKSNNSISNNENRFTYTHYARAHT
jgi:hypothetical protein